MIIFIYLFIYLTYTQHIFINSYISVAILWQKPSGSWSISNQLGLFNLDINLIRNI